MYRYLAFWFKPKQCLNSLCTSPKSSICANSLLCQIPTKKETFYHS